MRRFFWIRLVIFLRQSRWGFALLALWFGLGTFLFFRIDHLPLREAFVSAIYFRVHQGQLWELYSFWGQCVLFGIVISIFFLQALQRYNPQEGCRMLAGEMKDHIIVVGHSHLGARIVDHLRRNARPYVLIDRNAAVVDDLVRAGEPVVVDDARQQSTLVDAGVQRAKLVVITTNNIESGLLVTKRARELNKSATIVVRCFLDEFTEILESLGANEVISSSKSALHELSRHISDLGVSDRRKEATLVAKSEDPPRQRQ
jgi:voltage-gated potassium channel Kch